MRRPTVRSVARRTLARLHLLGGARVMYRGFRRAVRAAGRVDRRLARRTLAGAGSPKLHLGCGGHLLDGWLNTDLHPRSAQVARLDVRRRFPFAGGVFAFVYGEHLIEHVSLGEGAAMLRECFRVLSPGGRIRVATPDLRFLTALHRNDLSPLQQRYLAWAAAETPELPRIEGQAPPVGFVIHHFLRAWGHRIIYDEPMLRAALEDAGFTGVTECGLNDSGEPALRGLANEERLPEGFLRLETLTLEATKPAPKPSNKPSTKSVTKIAGEAGAGTGRRARPPAGRSPGAGSAAS